MHLSKRTNFLILLFFTFTTMYCQLEKNNYILKWYSVDDNSLPQNSVKSIVKDKNGFIWMSTENGLVRYDGTKFEVYNSENTKGFKSNRMRSFRGSVVLDSIFLQNDYLEYILIANSKIVAIPRYKVPKKVQIKYNIRDGKRFYINKIFKKDNSFYLFEHNLISLYDKNSRLIWKLNYKFDLLTPFFVLQNELFTVADGQYIHLDDGVAKYRSSQNNFIQPTSQIIVNHVAQQAFIISNNTVLKLELKNGKISQEIVLENTDLTQLNIVSALYDNENNILYLGSGTNGLLVATKKEIKTILGTIVNGVYYAHIKYDNGNLLTTAGEVFNTDGVLQKTLFQNKSDNYSLVIDRNNDIWTKADNVVIKYNKKDNYNTYLKWKFKNRVTQIFQLNDGSVIIGTGDDSSKGGKLYILEGTIFVSYMNLKFNPTYMLQLSDNILWTGSNLGLHKILFRQKKVLDIEGISNTYVRSLYASTPNEIWITTYDKGFFLYNSKTGITTTFPLDKNKYLLSSHCIVEDGNGYFWISTNRGLFQILKRNLVNFANNKIRQVYYHYYDRNDGLLTNEFNGGCQPCGILSDDHNISFPSIKGLVVFNSLALKPKLPSGELFFEQIKVDNKDVSFNGNQVVLSQGFGRLSVYIASPYYGNDNNLNIEIKVDGPISQDWSSLKDNYISFTTLPPGIYYITARKLTGFDSHFKIKKFKIIIPKLFYQTYWFYSLLILLLLLLTFYLFKLRIRYIRRKNILLEKKIQEQTFHLKSTIGNLKRTKESLGVEIKNYKKLLGSIAHDIRTPIRYLALTSKHLFENKDDSDVIAEDIENIHSSSFQLYNFVNNLVEYAKVSEEDSISAPYNFYELVEDKINIFRNIASSRKIIIINSVDKKEMITLKRNLFSIIIHNLLDNAVKNTYSGTIQISMLRLDNSLEIKIADTGVGMNENLIQFYNMKHYINNKNTQNDGIGLQMIQELLEIIKGQMHIESKIEVGTSITLSFEI